MTATKTKTKDTLRHNEYYDIQSVYDDLYAKSKQGEEFENLYDIIVSEQNILLAYRNIKSNEGSNTAGVNHRTIKDWKNARQEDYTRYVRKRLQNYFPHKVRRVEIPKPNGKMRPLGIPTMEDRLIQQCIKQILEPILEAKFYPHSYGFRPNRNTGHAINEFTRMICKSGLYYVIDIDIKGFFDNVSHAKLLKQLWTLGIRDRKLISIISKMLKAEIEGVGKPTKGTPQGGILSPLLSNVVLNELDWWIDSQWKSFDIAEVNVTQARGKDFRGNIYKKLRETTKLKEMHIVRYVDDFKILCRNENDSVKTFEAVKEWLNKRLGLEISDEKSQIVDIRKKSSEFLGLRFKARLKSGKWVTHSNMTKQEKEKAITKIREAVIKIKEKPTIQTAMRYNSTILGLQEYYDMATNVSIDFSEIEFKVLQFRHNQLKDLVSESGKPSKTYTTRYKGYTYKKQFVGEICLFPIPAVKNRTTTGFTQSICNYTEEGRSNIHDGLKINTETLHHLMRNPPQNSSTELADNRISLYSAQWGKCFVTGESLMIGDMEIHHKIPREIGGTDEYKNLVWITEDVHKLVHAVCEDTIDKYLQMVKPNKEQLEKVNELRKQAGNCVIEQE